MSEQVIGYCKHGTFILDKGCPGCIAEKQDSTSSSAAPLFVNVTATPPIVEPLPITEIFPPLKCPYGDVWTCLETKCGQWDIKTSQCERLATLEILRSIANSLSNLAKNSSLGRGMK